MRKSIGGRALRATGLLLISIPASAWAAPDRVLVRNDGALSVVSVVAGRGGVSRVLRETTATVRPGRSGADPAGSVRFADWDEDGVRFFALSRDQGETWSEAQSVPTELMLLDGATDRGQPLPAPRPGLAQAEDGRLFLVQFRTLSLPEWRDALAFLGAEALAYFPHNASIVRMAPGRRAEVAALDMVERVEPYHPSYRVEDALRRWLDGRAAGHDRQRVHVMALEWGAKGKERIAEAAEHLGATVVEKFPTGHVIDLDVDRAQLRAIAALDDVLWVDRWMAPADDMDLVRQDSGAAWLEATHGTCGQGVRGEVLDSGIQANHQDFDGVLFHGANDVSSHGTSTFGIVFGNGNRDGDGNAQATGQLPSAGTCASQGIFADYGFLGDRFAHTQQLKNSPYFASFQSNSWGSGLTTAYTSDSHQMDDIIWRLDIAIAQSQSNAGSQNSRPQAWAKNIISVGGIRHANTPSTSDDSWSGGASIGPAADGRIKPDVNYWYDSIFTTTSGSPASYTSGFGGTSAATPEVAGVLGLMVQMWSDNVWNTDPTGSTVFQRQPHASTIKALLINNAQQYTFSGTGHDLTRTHQGWGRPSVQVARERAAASIVVDEEAYLAQGQKATYPVDVVPGQSELKVTMTYPDPPGTPSASLHRVNDLSLKVTSPSGAVYHGNNGLLAGNYSTPGGSPNTIDTVENVFVASPEAGSWTVEVAAAAINQDGCRRSRQIDSVFALVVTGATLGEARTRPTAP
jgi:serine protease AprX